MEFTGYWNIIITLKKDIDPFYVFRKMQDFFKKSGLDGVVHGTAVSPKLWKTDETNEIHEMRTLENEIKRFEKHTGKKSSEMHGRGDDLMESIEMVELELIEKNVDK